MKDKDKNAAEDTVLTMTETATDKNTKIKDLSEKSSNKRTSGNQSSLKTFFISALQDMYFAEAEIEKGLAKIKKQATTEELQDALEDHELDTRKHISRIEKVFKLVGEEPKKKKCDAIMGILKEVDDMISDTDDDSMTRDAALIIGAQKVEHYEIATYGGLVQIARTLGFDSAADTLETTLEEEEETDYLLTEIAEEFINFEASEE